jgi:hypothetical protein
VSARLNARLRVLCDAVTQYVENSEGCEESADYQTALELQEDLNTLFLKATLDNP